MIVSFPDDNRLKTEVYTLPKLIDTPNSRAR